MLVIGLTGGIGAGKTTVSKLFSAKGVPIIDADVIAREVTEQEFVKQQFKAHFKEQLIDEQGNIKRNLLREIIFKNPQEKKWIEALLHPLILTQITQLIKELQQPYCLVVIPLLIETGPYPFLNRILVVETAEHIRLARTISRDQTSEESLRLILASQASSEHRLTHADDVIINDGHITDLDKQVEALHKIYTQMSLHA